MLLLLLLSFLHAFFSSIFQVDHKGSPRRVHQSFQSVFISTFEPSSIAPKERWKNPHFGTSSRFPKAWPNVHLLPWHANCKYRSIPQVVSETRNWHSIFRVSKICVVFSFSIVAPKGGDTIRIFIHKPCKYSKHGENILGKHVPRACLHFKVIWRKSSNLRAEKGEWYFLDECYVYHVAVNHIKIFLMQQY